MTEAVTNVWPPTPADLDNLAEIWRLLDEAYRHALESGDTHGKSGEGCVTLDFSLFWDWEVELGPRLVGVQVYSYMLGPSRNHYFATTAEALTAVRQWHKQEMEWVPDD